MSWRSIEDSISPRSEVIYISLNKKWGLDSLISLSMDLSPLGLQDSYQGGSLENRPPGGYRNGMQPISPKRKKHPIVDGTPRPAPRSRTDSTNTGTRNGGDGLIRMDESVGDDDFPPAPKYKTGGNGNTNIYLYRAITDQSPSHHRVYRHC